MLIDLNDVQIVLRIEQHVKAKELKMIILGGAEVFDLKNEVEEIN
mgnify:CR=1 FL=1